MKKLEIEIPNNKEIDWEASARQKQIIFKDKHPTYEDVSNELFAEGHYYISTNGSLFLHKGGGQHCPNNATTKHQLECILAKNKLVNVATYLNNGWKPNLESDYGYAIAVSWCNDELTIDYCAVLCMFSSGKVIFKSKELAQKAIEILGREEVKLALEPLY